MFWRKKKLIYEFIMKRYLMQRDVLQHNTTCIFVFRDINRMWLLEAVEL